MKYRHYAPKAPMYLFEGEARSELPLVIQRALAQGLRVGVLCGAELKNELQQKAVQAEIACWGDSKEQLAADLFYLLRDFDRTKPQIILAEGVDEDGIGLAIMNRMRKAAGYQLVTLQNGSLHLKNNVSLPDFMVQ